MSSQSVSNEALSVFTIGHSTHSLDAFVTLLKSHNVTALADVRSVPFSRFNPHFNKDALKAKLDELGIKYVFLGNELGARSDDRSCYVNGRIQYARLSRTKSFVQGVDRVVRGAREYRIALMCAEKEPLECHRTLLVARALDKKGIGVTHILGDGKLEAHSDTLERLVDVVGLVPDFFHSRKELVAQALARQEEKIAYVDDRLTAEALKSIP
jgi:uncharacterized protein (DUF488 family)